ncbi:L-threonylcarbamoyladenylate synthase [Imperialibacter roseus]|uniref:Threonylcarbamoyl-AMP synthase n=1 Tax=Imperialibacter roseus TaxID=1324217 RepID=A0ABZ0IIE7_9BACT|nr:L-threonylcarbamoyladenylate synthase [Imperialibacter roseus]WOK04798.1 L-threonylcarbamoyladenylate synthase [Imperialibacter roseus]
MAEIGIDIDQAKSFLDRGQLIGLPTETVYGLAGNAFNESAVLKIFQVKNRPSFDPLIAHTNSLEKVKTFVKDIPDVALDLAEAFWPGPLTLLLPKKKRIPLLLTSGLKTVAVRIPDHPITTELLEKLDYPLAAPSANPFGYVSPTTAHHVQDQLGEAIPYILDGGPCRVGIESTIIGFENNKPVVYRLGGKRIDEIEKLIGTVRIRTNMSSDPTAPGMLKSHYAPVKRVVIGDLEELIPKLNPLKVAVISFQKDYPEVPENHKFILSKTGNIDEAAANLFSAMRKMDKTAANCIVAEYVPEIGLGKAINDRLKRAQA